MTKNLPGVAFYLLLKNKLVMIKALNEVQTGLITPRKFKVDEITRRCFKLQLSRHQDIESVHTAGVNTVDIERSENRYLLSGCADGSLYIHDVDNVTGQPFYTAKCLCKIAKNSDGSHKYSVECVTWYGNDKVLFITSGTDKYMKIWDANVLKPIESFHFQGRIYKHDCSVVPTSKSILAVASSINHIELVDLRTGSAIHELRGHSSSVFTCNWSPTEEYLLASGGIDKKIFLWDIRSSKSCLKQLDQNNRNDNKGTAHSGYVNGLQFTLDGLFLISFGTDHKLRLWDTFSGRIIGTYTTNIKNDGKKNIQFAISSDSKPAALYVPSEGNIYIFEMITGRLVNILYGHFHSVNCCFFHEWYQELYSGGNDRNILWWTADKVQNGACDYINEENNVSKKRISKSEDMWSSDED